MRQYVVLAAAGQGKRLRSSSEELPKQLVDICGRPLLAHTLLRVAASLPKASCVIALPSAHIQFWHHYCQKTTDDIPPHSCVVGGATRFASIRAALRNLSDTEALVAVHDGVRPLFCQETFLHCFAQAKDKGSAVCVEPLTSSLRAYTQRGSEARDRSRYCLVQTPQVFRLSWLRAAFAQSEQPHFSDEATAVEAAGYPISLLEGDRENRKITYEEDLAWLRWRLSK